MTTYENKSQPLLVTILASAISSVGYGVSLFAIGVIWLLPSAKPAAPVLVKTQRKPKHHRRRSAPPVLQSNPQRPPLPTIISNSSKTSANSPRRRVYFADPPSVQTQPPQPPRRHTSPIERSLKDSESINEETTNPIIIEPVGASPHSSSSTLVHSSPPAPPGLFIPDIQPTPISECPESDTSRPSSSSSSRTSSLTYPRFTDKIRPPWSRKVHSNSRSLGNSEHTDSGGEATHSDEPSCAAGPSTPVNKHKRKAASLGFSWPISKGKTISETSTTPPSSPKTFADLPLKQECRLTSSPLTPFVRPSKQQRRVSAPVRARTQPYAYPYFASPPTVAGEHSPPLTAISPVVASVNNGLLEDENAPDIRDSEGASGDRRRQSTVAQASPARQEHGIPPQRRSLSESFALDS
ncbi:hypothetical protein C8R42DRAFT_721352 [Lentinula raphanica]|nr:hypothetical protein C8R42DRAFT_721352 [Lentinula raphanica]KAJ3828429.1 hypothetical protein F5880DRAFT_1530435 [Lentinula raphanica]